MPSEQSTRTPSGTPPKQGSQQPAAQPGQKSPGSQQPQQDNRSDKSQVQGEGDYRANERYTESAQAFVESGKVKEAARQAKPETQQQAEELRRAEQEGKSHAKGEKP
jgi:hypothetical protein